MAGAPVFLHHPFSLEHETGYHPEHPARITAIQRELESRDWLGYDVRESPRAGDDDLEAVHPERYIASIEHAAAAGVHLDPDTVVSRGSYKAAIRSAGGAIELVDLLLSGEAPTGFSAHRPPGHHARPEHAMGFCLFNNVAIAARHAVRERGVERVFVLDWDVHHGNGTAEIFAADPTVLFVSIHQWPLYPGTGHSSEEGVGAGAGFTINLPVPSGSGDAAFCSLVEHIAVPVAREYQPGLILISAGYDAHDEDPLAECTVSDGGFATMATSMALLGKELGVPVAAVLEGGYALPALARGVAITMETLARGGAVADGRPDLPVDPLARSARGRLSARWPALAS